MSMMTWSMKGDWLRSLLPVMHIKMVPLIKRHPFGERVREMFKRGLEIVVYICMYIYIYLNTYIYIYTFKFIQIDIYLNSHIHSKNSIADTEISAR